MLRQPVFIRADLHRGGNCLEQLSFDEDADNCWFLPADARLDAVDARFELLDGCRGPTGT
jgi:hypothetical protein